MASYIGLPIETDPEELAEIAFRYLSTEIRGWEPADGNLETWIVLACAHMVAEARDVASTVPPSIMRWFGGTLLGMPPDAATRALATSTWRVRDRFGYTIPAGTPLLLRTSGDGGVTFTVAQPVTIPAGSDTTAPGGVQLVAQEPGALTLPEVDPGDPAAPDLPRLELLQTLEFVETVALEDGPVGGDDAETDDEYLERLAAELQLMAPRPILPDDFAVLARREDGVERALALNLYDPSQPGVQVERTVTVAVVGANGRTLGDDAHQRIAETLERYRELNFVVHVIGPTLDDNEIDVSFDVVPWDGFDVGVVRAAANDAVTRYLSPGSWGRPPDGALNIWVDEPIVRYLEVAEVLQRVPGVRYIRTLAIGRTGDTLADRDVRLAGPAALPRANPSIAGTVNGV